MVMTYRLVRTNAL